MTNILTKRLFFSTLILFSLFLVGCSDGKVPLKGKVVFSDDQSPLTVGTVVFTTDTFSARGDVTSDGTYVMGSVSAKDGLPPGTYKVYLIGTDAPTMGGEMTMETRPPSIHPKYTSPDTTPLTVTVDASTKTFDFEVERNTGR